MHLKDIEVFASSLSYLLYLTLPVNAAMIIIGFVHKDQCPADVRLPRYLFFGGLAGLMAIILRIVLVCSWRGVRKKHKGIKFDAKNHPGLSMVRSLMYIFLVFYVIWNVNATFHVFSVQPTFDSAAEDNYCHPVVYKFSYVLVITFDAIAGFACLIWMAAIMAGICWPQLLTHYGYFITTDDDVQYNDSGSGSGSEKKSPSVVVNLESAAAVSNGGRNLKSSIKNAAEVASPNRMEWKQLALRATSSEAEEEEDSEEEEEEERDHLSIVRFAREVNSRRISVDYHLDRLDITNFPSGPLLNNSTPAGRATRGK